MGNIFYLIVFLILDAVIIFLWLRDFKKRVERQNIIHDRITIKNLYTDFLFVKKVLDENEKTHKVDTDVLYNLIELFSKKYPAEYADKSSMYLWHYIFEDSDVLRQLAHRMDKRGEVFAWKLSDNGEQYVPVKIK